MNIRQTLTFLLFSIVVMNFSAYAKTAYDLKITDFQLDTIKRPKFEIHNYSLKDFPTKHEKTNINIFLAENANISFSIRSIKEAGYLNALSKRIAGTVCDGATVIVNGGFYDKSPKDPSKAIPKGLVKSDGEVISRSRKFGQGGFLVSDGKTVDIVKSASDAIAYNSAIQSLPIIIDEYANDIYNDDLKKFSRTMVAIGDGKIYIIIATSTDYRTISLFEAGMLFTDVFSRYKIKTMIGLDGGMSSTIFVPDVGFWAGFRGEAYIENVLCFYNR